MNPIATLLLFPFRPRWVVRAHLKTPGWNLYLIHWFGLCVLGLILVAVDAVGVRFGAWPQSVARLALANQGNILTTCIVLAAGEATFVAVAGIMMCWCAIDEPVWATWRFAVRISWLYVSHLWWLVSVVFGWVVTLQITNADSSWAPPFVASVSISIIASMTSYFRGLTTPREQPAGATNSNAADDPAARSGEGPRICEWCGYDLTHSDPAGRCPECGHSVTASLDRNPRRRFAVREFHDAALAGWFRAESLFRNIAVGRRIEDATRMFVTRLLITLCLSGMAFVTSLDAVLRARGTGGVQFSDPLQIVLFVSGGLGFGCLAAWMSFMIACAVATLVGILVSRHVGRNRLTESLLVTMICSAVWLLWTTAAAFALPWCMVYFRFVAMTLWFTVNGLIGLWYIRAMLHRMQFVQYANR